jgi:hypothetical protein
VVDLDIVLKTPLTLDMLSAVNQSHVEWEQANSITIFDGTSSFCQCAVDEAVSKILHS